MFARAKIWNISFIYQYKYFFKGIYLWIATNFILNRFDHKHDSESHERHKTVGTVEIGGASLQIAYEVPPNVSLTVKGFCMHF